MRGSINKKIVFLLACILFLMPVVTLGVGASESSESVDWGLSDDKMILTGNKTYTYYGKLPREYLHHAKQIYEFSDHPDLDEDFFIGTPYVEAPYADSGFVWIDSGDQYVYVYATPEGKIALDRFMNGETILHIRTEDSKQAPLAASVWAEIGSGGETRSVDVTQLKDQMKYSVYAYDTTMTLSYEQGVIFVLGGDYYGLDYTTLGNQYFDADGNFSYRSGTVILTKLSQQKVQQILTAVNNAESFSTQYVREKSESEGSSFIFWIFFVLLGFLAPLPFLILGLILPQSKKYRYAKYWYSLSVFGTIWLVFAVLLMVLLLIL
ncbi:MAG: hypothetical protein IJY47_00730 [Clostridia bacterium]|nr:hypothetical protein [Clostridia bacterium]